MTKEELKQEAEEYYFDRLDPNAIDSISEIADANTEDFIVSTYLSSAEPREKRIEELEKENEMFKKANEIIAQQRDDRDADISILEKRIAELEAQIEEMCCGNGFCPYRSEISLSKVKNE